MALLEGALQSDRADRRRGPADDGAGGAGAGNSTVLGAAHRAAAHTNTYTRLHATSAYSHPAQTPAASVAQSARDGSMRLSHEALYTYLYVLPRGALRRELLSYL